MDHYRLLSAHPGDCEGAKHVLQILECASPSIDREKEDLFAAVEERGERMFFSQRKLEEYFRGTHEPYDRILDTVLGCECELCYAQGGEPLDRLNRCKNRSKEDDAWILVPIMIYLGKFHFVYPWLRAIRPDHVTSKGRIRQIECKDVAEFRDHKLLNPTSHSMERNLFRFAYDRVWCMFNPVRFEIDVHGWVVRQDLPDWARFPYQNENKVKLPQGQSSTVTYAEIPDEYIDPSVEHRMRAYPASIRANNINESKVYCVVRKAVKVSDDSKEGMQNETLSLLAAHRDYEGAENIITLLGLYTWRGSIHYIFPFVEQNLAYLLSRGYTQDSRDGISHSTLSLPDIWLWREMIGVAKALKFIHQGIQNPFPGDLGKVFAFHFDLKPENILVKWHDNPEKRRLQITDFGRSQIRLLDEGDAQSSSLYLGDPKYMAPEAWWGTQNGTPGEPLTVLQTYDVWSLACIMLEVLIYLGAEHAEEGGGPKALEEFDRQRGEEDPPLQFFARHSTKSLVLDKAQRIQSWLAVSGPVSDAHKEYVGRLGELLTRMFAFHMTDRVISEEVVNLLQEASNEYSQSRSEIDILHAKIRGMFLHEQHGFREVGWYKENNLVSFLTMEDIEIEVSVTSNGGNPLEHHHRRNCRIQLLYMEGQGHAGKFIIKWGLRQDQLERIGMLPIMDAARTQIMPYYRYQLRTSEFHHCILSILPESDQSRRWHVKIGFRQRTEVQAFQAALLHYRIMPGSKMYVSEAKWTMWHKRRSFRPNHEEVHQDLNLHFEFWEKEGPNYYNSHLSGVPSAIQPYAIIAIFRKGMPLLLLPLNTNDKRFKRIGLDTIAVDYNRGDNFKKFLLHSVNKQCRTCQSRNQLCMCDKSPWDDPSSFSASNEPAISLKLTLLNLSRWLNSSRGDEMGHLQGIIKSPELVNAQFLLQPNDIAGLNQEVECFRRAAGICWK